MKYQSITEKFCHVTKFKTSLCTICHLEGKKFLSKANLYPKIKIFTVGISEIPKIRHFREFLNFYPILGYYKIRTRTNFENPNGKRFVVKNCSWAKRFHSGHIQNTLNIKTLFAYAKYQMKETLELINCWLLFDQDFYAQVSKIETNVYMGVDSTISINFVTFSNMLTFLNIQIISRINKQIFCGGNVLLK